MAVLLRDEEPFRAVPLFAVDFFAGGRPRRVVLREPFLDARDFEERDVVATVAPTLVVSCDTIWSIRHGNRRVSRGT